MDGQALPQRLHVGEVQPGADESRLVLGARENVPPGVDDHAVPEAGAHLVAFEVLSHLVRRENVGLGLDRPGAAKHLPVVLAGLHSEGGRNGDDRRAGIGQGTIELGESDVVADRAADADAVFVVGDDVGAAAHDVGLAIALAAGGDDVEEMDFAVAGQLRAVAAEYYRRVVVPAVVVLQHAAGVQDHLEAHRQPAHQTVCLAVGEGLRRRPGAFDIVTHVGEELGQDDEIRPILFDRGGDEPFGLLQVRRLVVLRVHLNERNFHGAASSGRALVHAPTRRIRGDDTIRLTCPEPRRARPLRRIASARGRMVLGERGGRHCPWLGHWCEYTAAPGDIACQRISPPTGPDPLPVDGVPPRDLSGLIGDSE